jgi:hypothetical protein
MDLSELVTALSNSKLVSSPGEDEVSTGLWKIALNDCPELADLVSALFNACLRLCFFAYAREHGRAHNSESYPLFYDDCVQADVLARALHRLPVPATFITNSLIVSHSHSLWYVSLLSSGEEPTSRISTRSAAFCAAHAWRWTHCSACRLVALFTHSNDWVHYFMAFNQMR